MKIPSATSIPLTTRATAKSCAQAVAQDTSNNAYLLQACTAAADPDHRLLTVMSQCHAVQGPNSQDALGWPSVYVGGELTVFAAGATDPDFMRCMTQIDLADSPASARDKTLAGLGIAGVCFGLLVGLGLSTAMLAKWWQKRKQATSDTFAQIPRLAREDAFAQDIEMRELTPQAPAPGYQPRNQSPVPSLFKAPDATAASIAK